jgi:hypothetical protein
LPESKLEINAVAMDDGARRIEEMAVVSAGKPPQIIGERLTGEWACCKHGDGINIWQIHLLATFNRHQGVLIKDLRERGAVTTPIHGESTTGRNGMIVGGANHEGAQASQLLLQQTRRRDRYSEHQNYCCRPIQQNRCCGGPASDAQASSPPR